jgi:hypothetical protein
MQSKKTHIKMAQALRAAKGKLWDGQGYPTKHSYICLALEETAASPLYVRKTQKWIESLLEGQLSLAAYITKKTGKKYKPVKQQAMRQEFIDYLIQVLEAE